MLQKTIFYKSDIAKHHRVLTYKSFPHLNTDSNISVTIKELQKEYLPGSQRKSDEVKSLVNLEEMQCFIYPFKLLPGYATRFCTWGIIVSQQNFFAV